jgi:hypothetical protein
MLKPYVIATNTDYTLITMAESEKEALSLAVQYTLDAYGEERDDWEVYNLLDYLGTDDVLEL